MTVGCSSKEGFSRQGNTQLFQQDYNPPLLDILWMVDDRSPMAKIHTHLTTQATRFFKRLDQSTDDYRMAIVNADMDYAQGSLKPTSSPVILGKDSGTLDDRANFFGSIINNLVYNGHTSAYDKGFGSAYNALTYYFKPRQDVPLVLVFISDSEDQSDVTGGGDAVDFYSNAFLGLKSGNKDLLRAYSVNYVPLTGAKSTTNRCATYEYPDADQPSFKNKYFRLAQAISGTSSTGDLCLGIDTNETSGFADQIDLSGLRVKTLPKTFALTSKAIGSTVKVSVTRGNDSFTDQYPWTFDDATNSVDFNDTPPEGVTIQVTYDTN